MPDPIFKDFEEPVENNLGKRGFQVPNTPKNAPKEGDDLSNVPDQKKSLKKLKIEKIEAEGVKNLRGKFNQMQLRYKYLSDYNQAPEEIRIRVNEEWLTYNLSKDIFRLTFFRG